VNGQSIIGASKAMEDLWDSIREVADAEITVLIQGETGTGKELVAETLHRQSRRSRGPLVAVNCSSLSESLIDSELFGHDKGSFTGAIAAKKGRFEQANGGTLFLDEIGELTQAVQVKLLRVLQERSIEPVGSLRKVPLDIRLVAATNRDLKEMVAAGKFRQDLYFRLSACTIETPSLRERPEDLEELALHFAHKYARPGRPPVQGLSAEVLEIFQMHSWPGNVRELENLIQRTILRSTSRILGKRDLPNGYFKKMDLANVPPRSYEEAMNAHSRELCLWALESARGNWRKAARLLNMNRQTFRHIAEGHGLNGPPSPA